MVVIYTISGLIGYWLSYEAGVRFTIGASAAVCGLIGAALYYGKSRGGEYGKAVSKEVSGWIFGLFIFGLIFPGINNWGHGGGILGGIAVGYLLNYRERKADNLVHLVLSGVCIFATLAVLLWAVGTAFFYRLAG
jgi:rhomboid protease GluP